MFIATDGSLFLGLSVERIKKNVLLKNKTGILRHNSALNSGVQGFYLTLQSYLKNIITETSLRFFVAFLLLLLEYMPVRTCRQVTVFSSYLTKFLSVWLCHQLNKTNQFNFALDH